MKQQPGYNLTLIHANASLDFTSSVTEIRISFATELTKLPTFHSWKPTVEPSIRVDLINSGVGGGGVPVKGSCVLDVAFTTTGSKQNYSCVKDASPPSTAAQISI